MIRLPNWVMGIAILLVGSTALPAFSGTNSTDEHIVWQRAPIAITLPVGKERFVTFPTEVQFGYNTELLPPSVLQIQNDNSTVYFTAKQSFSPQRMQAKLKSGEVVLLDVSAAKSATTNPVDIVLPQKLPLDSNKQNIGDDSAVNENSVTYVSLTRYAIQQLYAPERLLSTLTNITRFPMSTEHVVSLFYDGSVVSMPLASWRSNQLYVTAIVVRNLLNQTLRLDSRLLCGNWKTASFYPKAILAPHGSLMNEDASTLFVVSDKPFSEAIKDCRH